MDATDLPVWQGSTWDRVCRELFDGDARRMLAWGRRYLRAYPEIQGEAFHLGARFREIVGARNRGRWWRTAVGLLERAVGEGGPPDGDASYDADRVPPADRVSDTTAQPYGSASSEVARADPAATDGGRGRVGRPLPDAAERLRIFDRATERQRRRERGLPADADAEGDAARGAEPTASARRGWTRDDLHQRAGPATESST